jgi:hypothetical protein
MDVDAFREVLKTFTPEQLVEAFKGLRLPAGADDPGREASEFVIRHACDFGPENTEVTFFVGPDFYFAEKYMGFCAHDGTPRCNQGHVGVRTVHVWRCIPGKFLRGAASRAFDAPIKVFVMPDGLSPELDRYFHEWIYPILATNSHTSRMFAAKRVGGALEMVEISPPTDASNPS